MIRDEPDPVHDLALGEMNYRNAELRAERDEARRDAARWWRLVLRSLPAMAHGRDCPASPCHPGPGGPCECGYAALWRAIEYPAYPYTTWEQGQ